MIRKKIIPAIVLAVCLVSTGLIAQNQPQNKVMNFIAVMDLKCGKGIDVDVCKSLTDVVVSEMVKIGKYTVIDRANRDKILAEQGFQQTGCADENCTVEAGRLLGVGKIVTGSIALIGQTYLVNLQLINVQTGGVEATSDEECKCELDGLIGSTRNATRKLMGLAPYPSAVQPPLTPTVQIPPPPQVSPPAPFVTAIQPPFDPLGTETPKGTPVPMDTSKVFGAELFPSYNPEKTMVVFYRPDSGLDVSRDVFEKGKLIGRLSPGTYFYYETEPGDHEFSIRWGPMYSTGKLNLSAGKTVFIRWRNGQLITFPDSAAAILEAKKCKYKPLK